MIMIRTQEISLRAGNVRNASMSDQSIDAAVNGNTKMLKVQYRAWFDSCEQPVAGLTVRGMTLHLFSLFSSLFGRKQF